MTRLRSFAATARQVRMRSFAATARQVRVRSFAAAARQARSYVAALVVLAAMVSPRTAAAEERYAVIVSGASGTEKFSASQKSWVSSLQATLQKRLGFSGDHVTVLSEDGAGPAIANRENVTRALASLKSRLTPDDTLLVVLLGHGTFDGTAAKFNLVGPDMDSREWKAALDGNPARLVFVNTTSSSFPFVPALAGKNRIIIAATDSPAQKYATLFPQYFIEALDQGEKADNDKNGRLSVWEAFSYASQAVKQAFEQQGTLVTERSVIDDNGDGVGKEAAATGPDGVLARTTFLDPLPASASGNTALAGLEKRRVTVEAEIEQLKAKKGDMPAGQYEEELERLAIELARIAGQIRSAK
jgi:hypothetical protein